MPQEPIKFEIVKHLGDLSQPNQRGWRKELNLISWNGAAPKYDIRDWSEDHQKMGKGATLTLDELKNLLSVAGQATLE